MGIKKNIVLYSLSALYIIMLFTSFVYPAKEVIKVVTKEVEVEIIKEVFVDKIEYKPINVYIDKTNINSVVSFYKDNYEEEYEKILLFYDLQTDSRTVTESIVRNSIKFDIPINLSFALAKRESDFNPKQEGKNRNGSYDRGLFQLNSTSRPKWKKVDFFNIEKNVIEALSCFKWLLENLPDDELALAAYNAGFGSITKKTIPYTTSIHVFEIKEFESKLNMLFSTQLLKTLNHIEYLDNNQFKLIGKKE